MNIKKRMIHKFLAYSKNTIFEQTYVWEDAFLKYEILKNIEFDNVEPILFFFESEEYFWIFTDKSILIFEETKRCILYEDIKKVSTIRDMPSKNLFNKVKLSLNNDTFEILFVENWHIIHNILVNVLSSSLKSI